MMKINIRHSEPFDCIAIKELYQQPSCYAGTLQLPHPSVTQWEKRLSNQANNNYSLVAILDNNIVGQIGMQVNTSPRRKHVANFGMGVCEKHRNKGIGSILLKEIISLANKWLAVTRIELEVYCDNKTAIAMYEKHGFVKEGIAREYAFRDGKLVDVILMAKIGFS